LESISLQGKEAASLSATRSQRQGRSKALILGFRSRPSHSPATSDLSVADVISSMSPPQDCLSNRSPPARRSLTSRQTGVVRIAGRKRQRSGPTLSQITTKALAKGRPCSVRASADESANSCPDGGPRMIFRETLCPEVKSVPVFFRPSSRHLSSREEYASNQEAGPPFRFDRSGDPRDRSLVRRRRSRTAGRRRTAASVPRRRPRRRA